MKLFTNISNGMYLYTSPFKQLFDAAKTEGQSIFGLVMIVFGVVFLIKRNTSKMLQTILIAAGAGVFIYSPTGMGDWLRGFVSDIFGIK